MAVSVFGLGLLGLVGLVVLVIAFRRPWVGLGALLVLVLIGAVVLTAKSRVAREFATAVSTGHGTPGAVAGPGFVEVSAGPGGHRVRIGADGIRVSNTTPVAPAAAEPDGSRITAVSPPEPLAPAGPRARRETESAESASSFRLQLLEDARGRWDLSKIVLNGKAPASDSSTAGIQWAEQDWLRDIREGLSQKLFLYVGELEAASRTPADVRGALRRLSREQRLRIARGLVSEALSEDAWPDDQSGADRHEVELTLTGRQLRNALMLAAPPVPPSRTTASWLVFSGSLAILLGAYFLLRSFTRRVRANSI